MKRQPENLRSTLTGFGSLVLLAIITWVAGSPILAMVFGVGGLAAFVVNCASLVRSAPRNMLTFPRR